MLLAHLGAAAVHKHYGADHGIAEIAVSLCTTEKARLEQKVPKVRQLATAPVQAVEKQQMCNFHNSNLSMMSSLQFCTVLCT